MGSPIDVLLATQIPTLIGIFGEPVTLPDASIVTGIFTPKGEVAQSPWSELGLSMRFSQQSSPLLDLRDADAATLAEQGTLTIRGTAYTILRLDPDGSGLTRLELMPATRAGNDDFDRWR